MKTEKRKSRLYSVGASGAALATASSIAGTIWAIYALVFIVIGQVAVLKGSAFIMLVGAILALAAGIASYRWAFNYFMSNRDKW